MEKLKEKKELILSSKGQFPEKELLKELSMIFMEIDDPEKPFASISNLLLETFDVENISYVLFDEEYSICSLKAYGSSKDEIISDVKVSTLESHVNWLIPKTDSLNICFDRDIQTLNIPQRIKEQLDVLESQICIPLSIKGRLIGLLNLGPKKNKKEFSSSEIKLMASLSNILATLINHTIFYNRTINQYTHHKNLLDNVTSGIIACDSNARITVFNYSAEKILNVSADKLIGKDVRILQSSISNLILNTLYHQKTYQREEVYLLPGRNLIGVSTSLINNHKGDIIGAVALFTDLQRIKHAQSTYIRTMENSILKDLSRCFSNQINNSLTSIKTFIQLIRENYLNTDISLLIEQALKDIRGLESFAKKFEEYAEPKEPVIQNLDIHDVLNASISFVIKEYKPRHIKFIKKFQNTPLLTRFDYEQLKEAFINILINSIEAIRDQGYIKITTTSYSLNEEKISSLILKQPNLGRSLMFKDTGVNFYPIFLANRLVEIIFQDNGEGISKRDLKDPSRPTYSLKKRKVSFGLAITCKIVENHNGFIHIESEEGQGTTILIHLPGNGSRN